MNDKDMFDKVATATGFIAALDQSGGSTPKALRGYGIEEDAYATEEEMFGLIHQMRSRIISSHAFTGEKVVGAILFEKTMDGQVGGARLGRRRAVHAIPATPGLGLSVAAGPLRRIGIFGGAFDPPHIAHVALARAGAVGGSGV